MKNGGMDEVGDHIIKFMFHLSMFILIFRLRLHIRVKISSFVLSSNIIVNCCRIPLNLFSLLANLHYSCQSFAKSLEDRYKCVLESFKVYLDFQT